MSTINYLIYDCEIYRAIPQRGTARLNGIEYCQGWQDFTGMGISVIGCYFSATETAMCYLPGIVDGKPTIPFEVESLQAALSRVDLIIGFNSRNFDDALCLAHGLYINTGYDLLEQIRIAAFGSNDWRETPPGHSYKLDALARANGIPPKTGSGELAPILWQTGKKQEVIDYCLHDLAITKAVLELGLEGKLVNPNNGELLQLPPLENFL